MKRIFFCASLMVALCTNTASACNTCGCTAGNQYMGLLPQTQDNFVGLKYSLRSYSSVHPDDGGLDLPGTSYEMYNTMQVWGRYALTKRLQVYAMVPYVLNSRKQDGTTPSAVNGIGDITVMASYKVLNVGKGKWRHTLLGGAGIKAPTGAYEHDAFTDEEGLPNMQPGTHSWDASVFANYTLQHNKVGLNVDASYTFTTPNHDSYKFGNRTGLGLLGFYQLQKGKLSVLPQLGARYDYAASDYENYETRTLSEHSGGWQLYAMQAVQAYYGKVGAQVACYEPLSQNFADGLVNTRIKAEAGVMLFF